MPGTRCAMYGCSNTYKNAKKCTFHRFPKPKDMVSETIRKEWIIHCGRDDRFNPDTGYICSFHFSEDDYERDLQNELLGLPVRRVLKKTAVPTPTLCNEKPVVIGTAASRLSIKKNLFDEPADLELLSQAQNLNCESTSRDTKLSAKNKTYKMTKFEDAHNDEENLILKDTEDFTEEHVDSELSQVQDFSCKNTPSSTVLSRNKNQEVVTFIEVYNSDDGNTFLTGIEDLTEAYSTTESSPQDSDLNYKEKYKELLYKYNDLNRKYSLLKTNSNKKNKVIKILNNQLRYFKRKHRVDS